MSFHAKDFAGSHCGCRYQQDYRPTLGRDGKKESGTLEVIKFYYDGAIRFDNRFIFYISPFTVFLCFNCASLIRSLPLHVQASAGLKILCKIFPKENLFLLTTFFF